MTTLQTALDLLKSKLGEFDNFKLLLGSGSPMSADSVPDELLRLAQGIESGEIQPQQSFDESAFEHATIGG